MVVGGSKVIAVMGTATSSSYMCVWQQVHVVMLAQVVSADSRSCCHGCLVTQCMLQWSCYHGALSGVLLSTSIWLLSVCDNRSCYHGSPSGAFGCPRVPGYLVCMTTAHAVMGIRLWVGGSRSYCHIDLWLSVGCCNRGSADCSMCTCMVLLGHTIKESAWWQ